MLNNWTKRFLIALGSAMLILSTAHAADDNHPRVKLQTNMGDILLELDKEKAPITVENFLKYVNSGHYEGTIFHRVISNFMIQGGGYTANYKEKGRGEPIRNEANNGLTNARGTIAMARTSDPHSATTQFFINVVDNPFLNHRSQTSRGWGYTVFGKVVEGMDVADKIRRTATGSGGPFGRDVPQVTVLIKKATVVQ
jgi:peptidyl-prolyl cis-trans isomerase B (cyclophilin B)